MGKGVALGESGTAFKLVPMFKNEAKPYLTKDYLGRLEDSIRQRTPIAGNGINIKVVAGSYNISVVSNPIGTPVALTVCSNGTPSVITVVLYQS